MKKLMIGIAISAALGLSGCDDETVKDVQNDVAENGGIVTPASRVVFDPASGVLSVPNDLLFSGTTDGTLNMPVDDPTDFGDPTVALSALDGWSTVNPFVIEVDLVDGRSIDAATVTPESVRVFEAEMGGPTASEACADVPSGAACRIIGELTYGTDFVAQAASSGVAVVPISPLKGKTSYIVVLTDSLMDTSGTAIAGSSTYDLVKQDINEQPLGTESQLALQGLTNSFETALASAGVDQESIIYSFAMTTQSTVDVLATVKSLMGINLQMGSAPSIQVSDTTLQVDFILEQGGVTLTDDLKALYSAANYHLGTITLPYYSGVPTAENPLGPINDWWKAKCDSAAILTAVAASNPELIPAEPVSVNDGECMAISEASGLPAPGLRDLGLDAERNLTKFNPVPAAKVPENSLTVQMTTPELAVVNAIRPAFGLDPLPDDYAANGLPMVILQHGITSKKEDMLAITGMLTLQGFGTVAIDHPIHGSRGYDLNGDGIDEINASTVSATHYMNLANLLSTRSNLQQSTADLLGLRLGLNFVFDLADGSQIAVDQTNVHFLGHSLGSITGINAVALANSPLNDAIDPMFRIATNSQAMPGSAVANFLLESATFGGVIKGSLSYEAVPEFKAFVDLMYPEGASEAELAMAFGQFYASLPPESQAELDATFAQFVFAAQTVTDAGDPANYAGILAATQTPTHLIEVVGDGADNPADLVIPNTVSTTPIGGTEGAIRLLGLPGVTETTVGSGAVRFTMGTHSSILDPTPSPAATQEMQSQVAAFFASGGQAIVVTDSSVVQQ